jgi:exopolysaccharide biosynthesis polyprenyl glycosylphosphotransferase
MAPLATTAVAPAALQAPAVTAPARRQRQPIPAVSLVAAIDVIAVRTALLLSGLAPQLTRHASGVLNPLSVIFTGQDVVLLVGLATATLLTFKATGLYDAKSVREWRGELTRVIASTVVLGGVVVLFMVAGGRTPLSYDGLIRFWAGGAGLALVARGARARVTRSRSRRVVIVGSGARALRLCRDLASDPLNAYQVLGFVDTTYSSTPFVARRTLGQLGELERILAGDHVDEVHVALPVRSHYAEIQETIRVCERVGVKLMYRADIFDLSLARPHVSSTSQVELRVVTEDGVGIALKRAIDIGGSLIGLVVLGPLMLAVAAAITLQDGGPVLFAQERYGLNRRKFRMLKFRSMVLNADKLQASLEAMNEAKGPVFKIARDPRITRLGRIIRRASIDELPQLVNVLRGDMSLIGPRPLPLRDVARFTRPADMRRFSVRPGITGLWQVSGRSNLDFETWITLDLQYIDNWSLALDFTILARTIPAVLRGTGAS